MSSPCIAARIGPLPSPASTSSGAVAEWHWGDLVDAELMHSLIMGVRPDEIYNLAPVSRPQLSWDVPLDAGVLNAVVPHRLYEIVRQELPSCRIYRIFVRDFRRQPSVSTK